MTFILQKSFFRMICFLILYTLCSKVHAYNISGRIIDKTDNSALVAANVIVKKDSTTIIMVTQSDDKGDFIITNINNQDVIVEISYIGYQSFKMHIWGNQTDLNMGIIVLEPEAINLNEVTIQGNRVLQKSDKYLIVPSQSEIKRASESINLLSELKMKMPGLKVNEALQTVSIDGGKPIFLINGKVQPLFKIQGINHQEILRIEYSNSPDIRYADQGATGIINFIMKPTHSGGFLMVNTNNAITTFRNRAQISASYHVKKSEWTFNYNTIFRDSKNEYTNLSEKYIGREFDVIREQAGLPSKTKDFDNNLSLDYTFMSNPSTIFTATLGLKYHDKKDNHKYNITERYGENIKDYLKLYHNNSNLTTPSLDLFFKKSFQNNQTVELNVVGTMSRGDYNRGLTNSNKYVQENVTGNKSWNMVNELLYTRSFGFLTTKFGFNYTHNNAQNDYSENNKSNITDKLTKDNVYLYGIFTGSVKGVGYNLGLGVKYYKNTDLERSQSYFKAKSTFTLNYQINKKWSVNYLFMYDPSMPALSSFSNIVQTIDDISVQAGNMNIKPSVWTRNRISINLNSGNLYSSLHSSYSQTNDPIINNCRYVSDVNNPYYNKFMRIVENGYNDKRINIEYSIGYQNLFNHISMQAVVGWDKFSMEGIEYKHHFSKMYASLSVNAHLNKWSLFANFEIAPQYSIWRTNLYRGVEYNYLGVKYNFRQWNFGLRLDNPLANRAFLQISENISNVNPSRKEYYIGDFSNMLEISLQYRIGFGKENKKVDRTLRNKNFDSGVNIDY